jgi:hypothetical protein
MSWIVQQVWQHAALCDIKDTVLRGVTSLKVVGELISIYIQQDATLHSLFYLYTALHVSSGISTHRQEHKQLYLQHLVFVRALLLSAAIVEELEPV